MSRVDQYDITVQIGGTRLGTWDKFSGGEIDSEETKYKPGAMAPQVSLGGSVMVGNVTISRLYVLNGDHGRAATYKSWVGKAAVTVTKQPLDVDGHPFGSPLVYNGTLKRVTFPE